MTIAKFRTRIDLLDDLIRSARADGGAHLQDVQSRGRRQSPSRDDQPMEIDDQHSQSQGNERLVVGEAIVSGDGFVRDGASGADTSENGLWL